MCLWRANKQLLQYLMIIIAAMHWTACGWGMMATFSDDHHAYWATQDAIDDGNTTAHRLLKGSASTGTSTTAGIVSSSWLRRYEDENSLEEPLPISDVFALCLELDRQRRRPSADGRALPGVGDPPGGARSGLQHRDLGIQALGRHRGPTVGVVT